MRSDAIPTPFTGFVVKAHYHVILRLRNNKNRVIHGIEHLLPDTKISIDSTPPKIFGALDGIAQPAYLQKDIQFEQKFIDDAGNPRYEIVPIGEASPLKYETIPTIYR